MDKLRNFFNGEEDTADEQNGIIDQITDSFQLSNSTRFKGFVACFVIGFLLFILASFPLFLPGGVKIFVIFYTFGNILLIASTCFLMGPINQLKKMFAPTRIIATILVFVSLGLALYFALIRRIAITSLLFIIIQTLAMLWYSLSYIPYARDAVKKTVEACIA
ncbi:vesicle transport protein SFT2A isoform X1 [Copidosoma floridanum]|uniref:vesicle transport protein SFT2A isoform X1 n=1 Tax=Copidosoma floridanum TaxID=29053 RepID=UPI0006C96F5E|nr:vesicle transport protein SFT2A isoform X1 [Copidosoma floridanum]